MLIILKENLFNNEKNKNAISKDYLKNNIN